MGKDVHETLLGIVEMQGGMGTSEAGLVIRNWIKEGRYLRDLWG